MIKDWKYRVNALKTVVNERIKNGLNSIFEYRGCFIELVVIKFCLCFKET